MANSRFYSSIALPTTLTGGVGPSNTTIQVASTAGFPGSLPYTLALDYGAANEELVEVTAVGGLTLTVTRAIDSTSASTHNIGAIVRHVSSARDFTDSRTHEAASTNVHGLTGGAAVVGTTSTQTLTNKTLTRATGSLLNINMFNTGTNTTAIIGDSTNPTIDRLQVIDNEVSLNAMIKVNQVGAIYSIKTASDLDTTYRFRVTDSDGTTDRWYALSGGTMSIRPTSTTTQVGIDYVTPDTSTTKKVMRVASSGVTNERFTIWNDGHVAMVNLGAANIGLSLTGAPSASTDTLRVSTSGGVAQLAINDGSGTTIKPGTASTTDALVVGGGPSGFSGNILTLKTDIGSTVLQTTNGGVTTVTGDLIVTGLMAQRGARKTADQTVTNSTTQTDDTHLFVSVAANAVYTVEAYITYNALAAADVNLAFTVPAGASGSWTGWGVGLTQSAQTTDGYTLRAEQNTITQVRGFGGIESGGVAQDISVNIKGLLTTAGTAGTFRLQWAQRVANAQGTILRADSWIRLNRIA